MIPAHCARSASISDRLDACPITQLEVLNIRASFDNDTGAFVARRSHAECGHRWQTEIAFHHMDIGRAEAGEIEPN
jgi:hypothetical protein